MEIYVILLLLILIVVSKGTEDDNSGSLLGDNNINININRSLITNNVPGNLPRLFLLGPQKSGSSSLFEYLIMHPQLCGGIHKEDYYFSNDALFEKGRQENNVYYKKLFINLKCNNKPQTMFMDATPQFHLMYKVLPRFPQIYTKQEMQVKYNYLSLSSSLPLTL